MTIDRRQINDDRRRQFGDDRELIAFVCECADDGCGRTVPLSPGDFELARSAGTAILDPLHESYSKNATTARIA